ncbi:MAG: hypothetical protein AB1814_11520 [Thermodesulfobacteriota bacterium]
MQTFIPLKDFVANPRFAEQRAQALAGLNSGVIDPPLRSLAQDINQLSYCFTLQSCYGHFVHRANQDQYNLAPLPNQDPGGPILYRLAYLTLCLQENQDGRGLLLALVDLGRLDPEYIQVGCAQWFWDHQVNTFVIQVEPEQRKDQDTADVSFQQAKHLEQVKGLVFKRLRRIVKDRLGAD